MLNWDDYHKEEGAPAAAPVAAAPAEPAPEPVSSNLHRHREHDDGARGTPFLDQQSTRSASATGSDWVGTVRPWAVRLAAVVLATLSVSIVLAEATMVTKRNPDLSLFSVIVHSAVASGSGEFVVQLLVLVPLAYICYCTNFTLFHLAAFSFYHVVPGHTDAYSLLMSAALMCRFSAPLSFNFLNLIHVEGKTVFAHEMSSMSHLPLLGTRGFQLIFPIALLVFVICVLLNVHKRFQQFSDDDNGGDGDCHDIQGNPRKPHNAEHHTSCKQIGGQCDQRQ